MKAKPLIAVCISPNTFDIKVGDTIIWKLGLSTYSSRPSLVHLTHLLVDYYSSGKPLNIKVSRINDNNFNS